MVILLGIHGKYVLLQLDYEEVLGHIVKGLEGSFLLNRVVARFSISGTATLTHGPTVFRAESCLKEFLGCSQGHVAVKPLSPSRMVDVCTTYVAALNDSLFSSLFLEIWPDWYSS